MKVLFISNMYPDSNKKFRYQGVFVKEQIETLKKNYQIDYELFIIKGFVSKINYILSVFSLTLKLLFNRYDVIHIHYGLTGMFLLLNPFISKKNIVLTLHGTDIQDEGDNSWGIKVTKLVLRRVNTVILANEQMRATVERYNKNMILIPCGIDTDFFVPGKEKVNNNDKMVVLFPGDKNRAVKNYPLFHKTINLLIEKYNLPIKAVELHNMTRSEIRDQMQKANALLMTSISEGTPQTIKEAMSCNLPIVTTNVGDVSVLLKDNTNAYVVDSFNPEDLAEKLQLLLNSNLQPNLRENIFRLQYDQKSIVDKIHLLYSKIKKH